MPKETTATVATPSNVPAPYAELPEPLNSLGAAVAGSYLYVYSGHIGATHKYDKGSQSPHFRRLDLRERKTWEELPVGPAVQGLPLVTYKGQLIRTGGMQARNAKGETEDLISLTDAAIYNPQSKTWTALPAMPEGRSTHDAVVLGDHLYVVGGWSMPGGHANESEWNDSILRLNLTSTDKGWEKIETPFARRALAAATYQGKVYAIGGLTDGGDVVREVDVFDPATGQWSTGPELPGGKMQGFAPSAFEVGGHLYANGMDGDVYRLTSDGAGWESLGKLAQGRLTHRLLPGIAGDLLIVGGSAKGELLKSIESFPLAPAAAGAPVQTTRLDDGR
jgi:N-acetylneuraminic acid mutarotase